MAIEQDVVHTPGVRAHGDDGLAVFLRREGKAALNLGPEPHDVPAERVAQVHRAVGEAVNFLQADGLAVPEAGHYAATFSTEVDCEINAVWHWRVLLVLLVTDYCPTIWLLSQVP